MDYVFNETIMQENGYIYDQSMQRFIKEALPEFVNGKYLNIVKLFNENLVKLDLLRKAITSEDDFRKLKTYIFGELIKIKNQQSGKPVPYSNVQDLYKDGDKQLYFKLVNNEKVNEEDFSNPERLVNYLSFYKTDPDIDDNAPESGKKLVPEPRTTLNNLSLGGFFAAFTEAILNIYNSNSDLRNDSEEFLLPKILNNCIRSPSLESGDEDPYIKLLDQDKDTRSIHDAFQVLVSANSNDVFNFYETSDEVSFSSSITEKLGYRYELNPQGRIDEGTIMSPRKLESSEVLVTLGTPPFLDNALKVLERDLSGADSFTVRAQSRLGSLDYIKYINNSDDDSLLQNISNTLHKLNFINDFLRDHSYYFQRLQNLLQDIKNDINNLEQSIDDETIRTNGILRIGGQYNISDFKPNVSRPHMGNPSAPAGLDRQFEAQAQAESASAPSAPAELYNNQGVINLNVLKEDAPVPFTSIVRHAARFRIIDKQSEKKKVGENDYFLTHQEQTQIYSDSSVKPSTYGDMEEQNLKTDHMGITLTFDRNVFISHEILDDSTYYFGRRSLQGRTNLDGSYLESFNEDSKVSFVLHDEKSGILRQGIILISREYLDRGADALDRDIPNYREKSTADSIVAVNSIKGSLLHSKWGMGSQEHINDAVRAGAWNDRSFRVIFLLEDVDITHNWDGTPEERRKRDPSGNKFGISYSKGDSTVNIYLVQFDDMNQKMTILSKPVNIESGIGHDDVLYDMDNGLSHKELYAVNYRFHDRGLYAEYNKVRSELLRVPQAGFNEPGGVNMMSPTRDQINWYDGD